MTQCGKCGKKFEADKKETIKGRRNDHFIANLPKLRAQLKEIRKKCCECGDETIPAHRHEYPSGEVMCSLCYHDVSGADD